MGLDNKSHDETLESLRKAINNFSKALTENANKINKGVEDYKSSFSPSKRFLKDHENFKVSNEKIPKIKIDKELINLNKNEVRIVGNHKIETKDGTTIISLIPEEDTSEFMFVDDESKELLIIMGAAFNFGEYEGITFKELYDMQIQNQELLLKEGKYDNFGGDSSKWYLPNDNVKLSSYHIQQLMSEIGELLHADKRWKNIRNDKNDIDNKKEEIADCFIVLMNIAMFSGINEDALEKEIIHKMEIFRERINKNIKESSELDD